MKHIYLLARKSAWLLMIAMPLHAHAGMSGADVVDAEESVAMTIKALKAKIPEVLDVLSKVKRVEAGGTDGPKETIVLLHQTLMFDGTPVDELRFYEEEYVSGITVILYYEGVRMSPKGPSMTDPLVSFYNFFKSMIGISTKAY